MDRPSEFYNSEAGSSNCVVRHYFFYTGAHYYYEIIMEYLRYVGNITKTSALSRVSIRTIPVYNPACQCLAPLCKYLFT